MTMFDYAMQYPTENNNGSESTKEILQNNPCDLMPSAMNETISPPIAYLLHSSPRPTPTLHSSLTRTPNQQLKKRGYFSRDGPTTRISSPSPQGTEKNSEPASPLYVKERCDAEPDNHDSIVEKCFSPMVKEAVAFQGLTIQSPVISNSPISSFSSFTPSRMGKSYRQTDTLICASSPSGASPAHRQVPLTVISSSTHDIGIPLCTASGRASINSQGVENLDSVTTPKNNKDADHMYQDGGLYSFQTNPEISWSTSSRTPNRFLSPPGKRDLSNFILSPRSSNLRLIADDSKLSRMSNTLKDTTFNSDYNGILEFRAAASVMHGAKVNVDTDMNCNSPKERLSNDKCRGLNDDSMTTINLHTNDQDLDKLSVDSGTEAFEEGTPPVHVISLFNSSKIYEKGFNMPSKDTFASSKSLFNLPSNRSFEKLETFFYDDATDSDTDDSLSDTGEAELDTTAFVLGSPNNGPVKRKEVSQVFNNEACISESDKKHGEPQKQTITSPGNSFLPHGFNSESSMAYMNSENDLYGLHVIYEGYVSQGSMENLLGSMKSKRSRMIPCEDLLEMNRAQSNNSMGSLGLSLDEAQGLCHVNSARDLITPPVVLQQERFSPPPIKETRLSLQKY